MGPREQIERFRSELYDPDKMAHIEAEMDNVTVGDIAELLGAVVDSEDRGVADIETGAGEAPDITAGMKAGFPTWRVSRPSGVVCFPAAPPPMTSEQEQSLYLHGAIAWELKTGGSEVIGIARQNLSEMRSAYPNALPLLDEWEWILQETTDRIVARMLDPSEHGRDLRQVSPFLADCGENPNPDVSQHGEDAEGTDGTQ